MTRGPGKLKVRIEEIGRLGLRPERIDDLRNRLASIKKKSLAPDLRGEQLGQIVGSLERPGWESDPTARALRPLLEKWVDDDSNILKRRGLEGLTEATEAELDRLLDWQTEYLREPGRAQPARIHEARQRRRLVALSLLHNENPWFCSYYAAVQKRAGRLTAKQVDDLASRWPRIEPESWRTVPEPRLGGSAPDAWISRPPDLAMVWPDMADRAAWRRLLDAVRSGKETPLDVKASCCESVSPANSTAWWIDGKEVEHNADRAEVRRVRRHVSDVLGLGPFGPWPRWLTKP